MPKMRICGVSGTCRSHRKPFVRLIANLPSLTGLGNLSPDYSWVDLYFAQAWDDLAQNTAQISRNALASGFYGNGSNRGLAPYG